MADGSISQITLPNGSVYDIKDTTSGFITGMTILSYGSSTYADALAAYQSNKVVYCRASSNSNPSSGNQLRLAFLAYVNNQTTPTEFEFQYYRSVNTHSDSQQGDQVYVYKLNSAGTWSVTVREAYTKMVAGTGLSSSYSNGILTTALADAYGDTKNPYGTKTANYVLAGPTSGSATAPSFRALVAADIPDLSGTYLTSYTETDPTVPSWAKSDSKPSYNFSEIGSTPTTINGYGITDAYTKTEVDNKVSAVLRYKGVKATVDALPSSGNVTGDVWHVTATSGEYAWDGTEWQELGTAISIPAATGSSTTGVTIADHSTTTIYGVSSSTTSVTGVSGSTSVYGVKSGDNSTTTASKASGANGTAPSWTFEEVSIPNVTAAGSASSWTFEEVSIPNVTAAGSASSWTFEEKSIPNVTSAGSASSWTFEEKSIPNVTAVGSGSLTFTMDTTDTKKLIISHTHTAPTLGTAIAVQSKSGGSNGTAPTLGTAITVQSKSGGSNGSAPTLGTAIKVQSKSGGSNGSAPTLGTAIKVQSKSGGSNGSASTWSFTDVTVPIRADSATTVPTAASSATTVPIKDGTATTVVTSKTHSMTDSGHTHTI